MGKHSASLIDGGSEHPIVLFDGVCNLCNRAVNFVIVRDPERVFRFASLQSTVGERLLARFEINPNVTDSVVLIEEGRAYVCSTAVLRIIRRLGKLWPFVYCLIVVPRPLRDAAYLAIARRRYRWFGRREACRLPTPQERTRFL
jgi:predicted DCC family thiol-disulfide oxidoreductase YuxK